MTNKQKWLAALAALLTIPALFLARKGTAKWRDAAAAAFGLDAAQRANAALIAAAFAQLGDGDGRKLAYILATAWHESRLRPVRECFASTDIEARLCVADRPYGNEVNGHVYYGRGFVQLTWLNNYIEMGHVLGIQLADDPDKALVPDTAALIMVEGMMDGLFTGKKLSDYINAGGADYRDARRTVNGTDRAALIEGYALDIIGAVPGGVA